MKNERLLHIIGNIDDELIYNAAPQDKKVNVKLSSWVKWGAVAACIVVALFIGISTLLPIDPDNGDTSNITTQDKIIDSQEYGVVSLSSRSSTEITELALSLNIPSSEVENVSEYEDEKYIYLFYEDGTVAGIIATYLNDDTIDPSTLWSKISLSEEDAIALAKEALLKYCDDYTEETASLFSIQVTYLDENSYPVWQITFTEYTEDGSIQRNILNVRIDGYGNVAEVSFGKRSSVNDDELTQTEYITEENAVSLAIDQLEMNGYEVDTQDYEVIAQKVEIKGVVTWKLTFEEKADENGEYQYPWQQVYYVTLSAVSGELISIDIGR